MAVETAVEAQMKLRLPAALKDEIEAAAAFSKRTMNAEVVARLSRYASLQSQVNRLRAEVDHQTGEVGRLNAVLMKTVPKEAHDTLAERFTAIKEERDTLRGEIAQYSTRLFDAVDRLEDRHAGQLNEVTKSISALASIHDVFVHLLIAVATKNEGVMREILDRYRHFISTEEGRSVVSSKA